MYIFTDLRKDFFTKFFIVNKNTRLGYLRGFKSLILQKSIFFKSEETELGMHSSDLIEGLVGLRPNILKVIFKATRKKKKSIVVLLQTKLNSSERVTGLFDTMSVFVIKLSRRIRIKGKRILVDFRIKKKSNYLVLDTGSFPHLLWGTQKMFDYSLKNKLKFDLSFFLTFPFTKLNIIILQQYSFLNLVKTWLKVHD